MRKPCPNIHRHPGGGSGASPGIRIPEEPSGKAPQSQLLRLGLSLCLSGARTRLGISCLSGDWAKHDHKDGPVTPAPRPSLTGEQ